MAVESLLRLKEHYTKLAAGELMMRTANGPSSYPRADIERAKVNLAEVEKRLARKLPKEQLPKLKEVKEDGKKSKG